MNRRLTLASADVKGTSTGHPAFAAGQGMKLVPGRGHAAPGGQVSCERLADLDAQARTARGRETLLWVLFVLVFLLTLAAGGTGVALIFLASLKVGIASGAAAVLPGCTSALLKRECTIRSKICQDIEEKRDGEFRLRQAASAIADLPDGPHKERLRIDYARTMLSRVPK